MQSAWIREYSDTTSHHWGHIIGLASWSGYLFYRYDVRFIRIRQYWWDEVDVIVHCIMIALYLWWADSELTGISADSGDGWSELKWLLTIIRSSHTRSGALRLFSVNIDVQRHGLLICPKMLWKQLFANWKISLSSLNIIVISIYYYCYWLLLTSVTITIMITVIVVRIRSFYLTKKRRKMRKAFNLSFGCNSHTDPIFGSRGSAIAISSNSEVSFSNFPPSNSQLVVDVWRRLANSIFIYLNVDIYLEWRFTKKYQNCCEGKSWIIKQLEQCDVVAVGMNVKDCYFPCESL